MSIRVGTTPVTINKPVCGMQVTMATTSVGRRVESVHGPLHSCKWRQNASLVLSSNHRLVPHLHLLGLLQEHLLLICQLQTPLNTNLTHTGRKERNSPYLRDSPANLASLITIYDPTIHEEMKSHPIQSKSILRIWDDSSAGHKTGIVRIVVLCIIIAIAIATSVRMWRHFSLQK